MRELRRGAQDPAARVLRVFRTHSPDDVLHHHNRIVDDKANRRGHAAERHDVEAHLENEEEQNRGSQDCRHSKRRDERHLPVPQKENENK